MRFGRVPAAKDGSRPSVFLSRFTSRITTVLPFHNESSQPVFDVFRDPEDGQRVAEFNPSWIREYLAEFARYCQWAREKGQEVPGSQYAFAKKIEALL